MKKKNSLKLTIESNEFETTNKKQATNKKKPCTRTLAAKFKRLKSLETVISFKSQSDQTQTLTQTHMLSIWLHNIKYTCVCKLSRVSNERKKNTSKKLNKAS